MTINDRLKKGSITVSELIEIMQKARQDDKVKISRDLLYVVRERNPDEDGGPYKSLIRLDDLKASNPGD